MEKQELKNYLIDECEYTQKRVDNMSPMTLVDRYLRYNGIIGYTEEILRVIEAAYEVKLEEDLAEEVVL